MRGGTEAALEVEVDEQGGTKMNGLKATGARPDGMDEFGVEEVLVINLKKRPDRWIELREHVASVVGVHASDSMTRVDGVDGGELQFPIAHASPRLI